MESKEMSIDIEEFEKMPDKVRKIYEAVGELAREGRDVTTLRVSEISAKAGIGKGTTYEYFTSKEELISKAVFYSMYTNIKTILLIMYGAGSFKEKFYNIMDYMWGNRLDDNTVRSVINVLKGTPNPENVFCGFPIQKGRKDTMPESVYAIEKALVCFLNQGIEEGIIKEKDEIYKKNVLCSQLIQFIFFIQDSKDESQKKDVEDFVYNGLVMMLNYR